VISTSLRNFLAGIVKSLDKMTRRGRSNKQEVLAQIEAGWNRQSRRPTAKEIDEWIEFGRS